MIAERLRQAGLVAAIAAFVMFANLGGSRLWDRDEPRNAGCAREMLQRGDWVVPVFNDELRTHKPVLLYWAIMASYLTLGVSEFAARLPSALAAVGSTVCVYLMGRRLFSPRAGVWAGIALATSLTFVVAGRAATPDSLLIFCTTLALTIYVCGTFRPRFETTPDDAPPECRPLHRSPHAPREGHISRSEMATIGARSEMAISFPQHWPTVAAMYGAMGLGVLAKGPVGFILPTAVIGMFLLIVRLPGRNATEGVPYRWLAVVEPLHFLMTCWSMRPVTALLVVMAVALPWYAAVGMATDGAFLRGFFLEHNLGRATAVMENHSGSIFYYPLAILAGFFPWSVFAIPLAIDTVFQARRRDRFHAGYVLAVCWIGVYVGLFSLARTKLPGYVTPCYPALALLAGNYVDRWSRQSAAVAGRWLPAAFGCLALVGIAIAVGIPLTAKNYLPGEEWLGLIGLTPLAGGVVCIAFALGRNLQAAAGVFGASAVTFTALLFALGADRADRHQQNHLLLEAIHGRSRRPQVASYETLEPSWVFYGGLPVHEFSAGTFGTREATILAAAQFLAASNDSFLITTETKWRELSPNLPPDIVILENVPYFLRRDRLVLIGRDRPLARAQMAIPKATSANHLR